LVVNYPDKISECIQKLVNKFIFFNKTFHTQSILIFLFLFIKNHFIKQWFDIVNEYA